MKILHTSDWHLGRRWKGMVRSDEMAEVLEHLSSVVESENVDLILHSGDLFDSPKPFSGS